MTRRAAAGVLLALLAAPPAAAADKGDGFIAQLMAAVEHKFEAYSAYFPQKYSDITVDDSTLELWTQMTTKSSAKVLDTMVFQYELRTTFSTQDREMDRLLEEPGSRNLSPAYVDFEILKLRHQAADWSLTVGKDLLDTGLAETYSPANIFNRGNGANPLHGTLRGKWQVAGRYFIEDDTLSLAVVPFEQKPLLPPASSRWRGSSVNADFVRLDIPATSVISDKYHDVEPKNFSYLLKYNGVREGFDFYGALHYGPSAYPILKQGATTLRLEKEFPLSVSPAFGVTATKGAWKYVGEAIYQQTIGNRDQDFLKYVIEVSMRETDIANALGLDEIKPIVGYAGEKVFGEQRAAAHIIDSFYARPNRDSLLVRIEIQHNDKLAYGLLHTRNFTNDDYAYGIGAQYKPTDNLTLHLRAGMFGGDVNTHLGRFRRNDYVEIGVVSKF